MRVGRNNLDMLISFRKLLNVTIWICDATEGLIFVHIAILRLICDLDMFSDVIQYFIELDNYRIAFSWTLLLSYTTNRYIEVLL